MEFHGIEELLDQQVKIDSASTYVCWAFQLLSALNLTSQLLTMLLAIDRG
jgi:hypothetical protein